MAADAQDADIEKLKKRATLMSLLAAVFLTSFKLVIGLYTNSLAILSEALHSGLDLLAAIMTFYAIRISSMPADRRHPYGHGKVENLSALGETILLFVVCIYVGFEGTNRLLSHSSPVMPSLWGVAVMAVSMAVDINRVRVLRKAAKQANSQALAADALHFATDILASATVFVGVLAVWLADFLNLPPQVRHIVNQADTVAALIVAVIIFKVSLTMCRSAVDYLMDSGSEEVEKSIEEKVQLVRGVNSVGRLRMRSAGPHYFVDLCVGVDPQMRVCEGHRIAHDVESSVCAILPGADVTVHVDPCYVSREGESPIDIMLRLAQDQGLSAHDFHTLTLSDGGLRVEVILEFDSRTSFSVAYERARNYESAVRRRIPGLEIVTHIEPMVEELPSRAYTPEENPLARLAWEQVQQVTAAHPLVSKPHNFKFYMQPKVGVSISFHCAMEGILSVGAVHEETVHLEQELREALPVLGRVTVHVEPPSHKLGTDGSSGKEQTE